MDYRIDILHDAGDELCGYTIRCTKVITNELFLFTWFYDLADVQEFLEKLKDVLTEGQYSFSIEFGDYTEDD